MASTFVCLYFLFLYALYCTIKLSLAFNLTALQFCTHVTVFKVFTWRERHLVVTFGPRGTKQHCYCKNVDCFSALIWFAPEYMTYWLSVLTHCSFIFLSHLFWLICWQLLRKVIVLSRYTNIKKQITFDFRICFVLNKFNVKQIISNMERFMVN